MKIPAQPSAGRRIGTDVFTHEQMTSDANSGVNVYDLTLRRFGTFSRMLCENAIVIS
jgi:hypothetical protein